MHKRILSMLLALVLVLGILPAPAGAVGGEGSHISVLDTAPAAAEVAVGSVYELDLSTVFSDREGHALTYSLGGGAFGEHTKIADGKLYFSVSEPGDYTPVITASCEAGSTASHTIAVTVTEADGGHSTQYGYDETPAASVTVYVTISNDGMPILGNDQAESVLANLEVTVPYFDLNLYGLEQYYRYHTENGQGSYTDEKIVARPTALHLYIYLLERYYMGLPESECCKGTSGVLDYVENTEINYLDGTLAYDSNGLRAAAFSGSPTSFFMNNFWGHDLNLKYYRNHMYPLMSPGWGSTADYILLSDGDAIDVGLFSNWNFYLEGEFCCFDQNVYSGDPGSDLTVNLQRWNAANNELEPFAGVDVALYNSNWEKVRDVADGQTNTSAALRITLPETPGAYYLLGTDSNAATEDAVNAPAAARIEVTGTEPAVPGYLSDLRFTYMSSADSLRYELSPAFAEGNLAYTMLVPDNVSGAYAWATLSENAPAGSTITAKWSGTNGQDRSVNITSGKSSGQWMAYFLDAGTCVNSVTVEVGVEGDLQAYAMQVIRVQPSLTALSLEGVPFHEGFRTDTLSYTATTTVGAVTVQATPRDDSYTVTYNGGESNVIALEDGENVILVKVVNPGGYENTYEITVNKVAEISIAFDVTPEDAVVHLQDSFGQRLWPENGVYTLMSSNDYSYTVTKDGYIGQKNGFNLAESGTIEITLEQAPVNETIDKTIYAQWGSFRGEDNLGVTWARTPYTPEDAELLWAAKWGSGWAAAPNPPILVDGDLIVIVGSSIKRVDRNTGEVKLEGTMAGTCGFGIIPPTYGDGMIFVPLSGKVQAFNAKTLESLWVYTDPLGGQPNCPVTYEDGYVYVGFWNSETRDANFVCLSVTDEDPARTDESKISSWTYARAGGFYWAGAYATEQYVLVGTDDGQGGNSSETASLLVFDRFTGELMDSHDGIRGDIRSNVSYESDSDRFFFTSKGGVMCNAKLDWSTGKIIDFNSVVLQDSKGNQYAMSTCTPSVFNNRIYIGVAGTSQFGDFSGHGIAVFDLNDDGSMTQAYVYDIKGYPQTSAMVTTAYADEQEGYVYIYLPYNTQPGGVSVLKDKKGQTEPITTTDEGYSEVFTPLSPLNQYCICSTIADEYGTIYYKNDSCYTMAITSTILSITVYQAPTAWVEDEDGVWTAEGLEVVANLKNGNVRDVTDYVTVTESEQEGYLTIAYTYGFDSENYGLTTLTTEVAKPVAAPVETEVVIKLSTNGQTAKLYTLTDGVEGETDMLAGVTPESNVYTTNLCTGEYRLYAYDSTGNCNGSMKLVVTREGEPTGLGDYAERNHFFVLTASGIYATNKDAEGNLWVDGTDYTVTGTAANQAMTFDRESTFGVDANGKKSMLCLEGDAVKLTFTPNSELHPNHLAATLTRTLNASYSYLSTAIPEGVLVTFVVPDGATVDAGRFHTYYVYDFYELCSSDLSAEGTDSYTYRIPKSTQCFYRVQHEDGVTYWNFASWSAESTVTVSAQDLYLDSEEFTPSTIYRYEQNRYDLADIYVNVNEKGYMNLDVGQTYELNVFRNWMSIESFINSKVALPDMHYQVIDPEGKPSNILSIDVHEKNSSVATVTANQEGTAIILVTYDAMTNMQGQSSTASKRFSAIWPENTGVIVVTVDADGTAIQTNMTINEGMNASIEKLVGDTLDAEHDPLFYAGSSGASYTFTPESGCTVTVNRPVVGTKTVSYQGFTGEGVTVNEDGSVTLTGLTTGRNIVRVEKDGLATYQIITAKQVSYELQDANGNKLESIKAGDTVKIQFTGLTNPVEKMSGNYNFNANLYYVGEDGTKFGDGTGGIGVYDFNGNPARQTRTVTIPKYWTGDTYTLTDGAIRMGGFGSPAGAHRTTTYAKGLNQNFTARSVKIFLGQLPEIAIQLEHTDFITGTIRFQDETGKAIAPADLTVTLSDEEGNRAVMDSDGKFLALEGVYSYTAEAAGYEYAYGTLTVTAGGENTFVITLKTAAQEAWDGVTETEPAKDEDGVYQITNGAELAWFTKQSQSGAAVTGVLCNDIDLANYPWTYKGASGGNATILDGQGHEIIKLNSAVGLFYYMNNGSQLRNLTVRGSVNAADNAGGIVYDFRGSLIENVTSYVDVTVTATSTRGAGGIVYAMRNGAIRNCANHGSVSSTYSTGGIVGSIYGWDVTIEGCYNTGNISSTNSGVGGIVGAATYNQLISDCYNTGTITGKQYVGGLVGDFRGGSSGSAQYQGPVTLTNGYNVGVVTGSVDDATYVASVAGRVQSAKLVNCYYLDTPSAGDANAVTLSDAQLRAQELGDAFGLVCYGYPALLWQKDVSFHTLENGVVTAPTCTEQGYTTYVCPKCGETLRTEYVDALGHTEDPEKTVVYKMYKLCTCAVCGETYRVWDDIRLSHIGFDYHKEGILYASFTDEGDYPWSYNENTRCFESTNVGAGNTTSTTKLTVTLEWPATVSFNYGASSEQDYDFVNITLTNGEETEAIASNLSGEAKGAFERKLEAGVYVFTFSYAKDEATNGGRDVGWVSDLKIYNAPHDPHGMIIDETYLKTPADCEHAAVYYYVCLGCGEISQETYEYGAPLGHEFTETVVAPTCEADGYTQHTCSRCDYNYRDQFTEATGHQYQTVKTAPTCTAAGYTTHTCAVCGQSYVDSIVEALGHTYEDVVTAPTHDKMGYTTHTCKTCGVSYVDSYTEALGHSYTQTVTKEPTCTEEGVITFTCDCGESYTEAIPMREHSYEAVVTEPTCEEMGYTTYTCKDCGHSYVGDYQNPKGHDYASVVTEPTCVTMGYTTYTCKDCGHSYMADYVDALGHDYEETVHAPTCTAYGYTEHVCKTCGHAYISDIQNALGHSYVLVNAKEATCTEAGYTGDEVCAVCGDVKTKGEVIEPLGHSFGQWTVILEAGCFTDGIRERVCTVCGHTERETIPANAQHCPSADFTDLKPEAWYHEAVDFVLTSGYMTGMGNGLFAPDQKVTRGQLVTILYRMASSPEVTGEMPFTDVAEGQYYYSAVLWAAQNGIATGMGGGSFAPNAPLTREQLVTFLARYAKSLGVDVSPSGSLTDFTDASQVSPYAADAMVWAIGSGLITGMGNNTLAPKGTATRAQAAQVIQRLCDLVG